MNRNAVLGGPVQVFALSLALWAPGLRVFALEANITRTNWSERCITNVIEVTMPLNKFVDQYRTNWVPQWRTNVVDVYATNWSMRTVTNPVMVDALWTNVVTDYRTNVITRTRTNTVAVNLVQTNVLSRYHTNWNTLNLTNWVTLVLLKTNWVTQPVTNVVQLDLPSASAAVAAAAGEAHPPKSFSIEAALPVPAGAVSGPLAIVAARTTRPPANDLVEVLMKVQWAGNGSLAPRVQSWRVQRADGAVFLFGQEQQFLRQLPVGTYSVEARLKAEKDARLLIARGTLIVTLQEAVIHQRMLAKK